MCLIDQPNPLLYAAGTVILSLTSVPIRPLSLQISYGPVSTLWLPLSWVYEESSVSVHPSLLAHWVDVICHQNLQDQFRLVGERMKEGTIRPWKDYDLKGHAPNRILDRCGGQNGRIDFIAISSRSQQGQLYLPFSVLKWYGAGLTVSIVYAFNCRIINKLSE